LLIPQIVGPSQEFYKSALMFLAYTPVEELAVEERITLATDMALAAVTGDDIFNFGEVLATPILDSLKGTDSQWLHDLVMSLHHGSINEFNSVVDKYREKYFEQPALSSKNEEVKKKVVLLALMNIAFERSANDRQISFTDIAARTCIDVTQVEWVVMRAMSLGLIKGTMDQVDQSVNVTWIQPRILDKEQLSVIGEQLDIWAGSVKETLADVTDQAQEILV
jgi:26S proteasome regulatory subunit N9